MTLSVEDKEEVRSILHETIMRDHETFDELLKNARKFRESPEGRLAVVETKSIETGEDIKEIKIEFKESRKEFKGDIKEVKEEIEALRKEIKEEIEALRKEVKEEIEALRKEVKDDIKDLRHLMLWMFGIMFTLYGGLIIYLINKMGS